MSSLARLFLYDKKTVTGSDRGESTVTKGLEEVGIKVAYAQGPENIPEGVDLVVYSDAVVEGSEGYSERMEAQRRGIRSLSYAEALGEVANQYYLIAVAGAHGKTTTTAMLIDVLEEAGLDPTAVVGSLRAKTKSNFRAGKSKYFIVEADEYMRHFLNYNPDILVITNIDADHLDYYKDLADIQSAFRELVERVIAKDGFVVTDTKSEKAKPVIEGIDRVVDYTKFVDPLLKLKIPGVHNLMNAGAVLAVADILSIEKDVARKALEEFRGTWRRFEFKGKNKNDALVYDDYGHHPAEVKATLKAARELFPDKKIVVAFQPHLYSRTRILFDDFVKAFGDVNEVLVAPIFAAREVDDGTVSHVKLAEAIEQEGIKAQAASFEDIETRGRELEGDHVLITMGAGELYTVAEKVVQK